MKTSLLSRRIPTLLALLFLGGGLAVGIFIVQQGGGFFPKASPESTPKQVKISNVSDAMFSVSFVTDAPVPSYIKYGTDPKKLENRVADDRDQASGNVEEYITHHITLRNLSPNTTYYFTIGTTATYYDKGEQPFTQKTGPALKSAKEAVTVYGNVVTKASTPAKDSLIYITPENGQTLSTFVKSTGTWSIGLSTARTADLSSFIAAQPSTALSVFVQGKDSMSAGTLTVDTADPAETITLGNDVGASAGTASTTLSDTLTAHESSETAEKTSTSSGTSASSIDNSKKTAGRDSDSAGAENDTQTSTTGSEDTDSEGLEDLFSDTSSSTTASPVPSPSPKTTTTTSTSGTTVVDLTKATSGTTVTTTQPSIKGEAKSNVVIQITVESDPVYTGTVETDDTGAWDFTPPGDLSPGEHTVTVKYTDPDTGEEVVEKKTFNVLAQGATGTSPSETTSSTTKSTKSSLPYFTSTPSASPKLSTRSGLPSTGSGVPVSGSAEQTVALLFLGAAFVTSGLVLWHKSSPAFSETEHEKTGLQTGAQ